LIDVHVRAWVKLDIVILGVRNRMKHDIAINIY